MQRFRRFNNRYGGRFGYRRVEGRKFTNNNNANINTNTNTNANTTGTRRVWEIVNVEMSKFLGDVKYQDNGMWIENNGKDIFDLLQDVSRKFIYEGKLVRVIGFTRDNNVINVRLLVLKTL